MPQRILSSLTWKAGVAVAATALAAGTGATTFHLVNDSHPADDPAVEVSDHATTTTTTVDGTTTTTVDDQGDDAATTADANATPEHPDNFGKTVSEDAKDGGVDGQEISDMAHERNAARTAGAEHATADDQGDEADDHGDEADDQGDEHRAEPNDHAGQDGSHQDDETDE